KDVSFSYIESGDIFNWKTKYFELIEREEDTIESPNHPPHSAESDVFSPGHLKTFIFDYLVNNESDAHTSLAINPMFLDDNDYKDGQGFKLTFSKTDKT